MLGEPTEVEITNGTSHTSLKGVAAAQPGKLLPFGNGPSPATSPSFSAKISIQTLKVLTKVNMKK